VTVEPRIILALHEEENSNRDSPISSFRKRFIWRFERIKAPRTSSSSGWRFQLYSLSVTVAGTAVDRPPPEKRTERSYSEGTKRLITLYHNCYRRKLCAKSFTEKKS